MRTDVGLLPGWMLLSSGRYHLAPEMQFTSIRQHVNRTFASGSELACISADFSVGRPVAHAGAANKSSGKKDGLPACVYCHCVLHEPRRKQAATDTNSS